MAGELAARIEEARRHVRAVTTRSPLVGVILGTGLGSLAEKIQEGLSVPYKEIPHFPVSTVEGHAGELVFGKLAGIEVVAMSGRVHYYEGYTMKQVTFPVRVMKALGCRHLFLSNAAGGLNPLYEAGDIVLTVDHVNLMGDNPLIGPNEDDLGPRFPDMSEPYDRKLIKIAEEVALEERVPVHKGVFAGVAGPNLETAAEYRFLRTIGADLVGMSLVPEDIVAVHAGLNVLAFSVVTDLCLPDSLEPADIQRILKVAAEAEPKLTKLVIGVLRRLEGGAQD
jgi:purine-nucleoside phosphorylase